MPAPRTGKVAIAMLLNNCNISCLSPFFSPCSHSCVCVAAKHRHRGRDEASARCHRHWQATRFGYAVPVRLPKFNCWATLPAGASAAAARSKKALSLPTLHARTACRGAMQKQPRVVIIGGGAAGMACAWSLARSSVAESVTVLEPNPHPGGVASTIDHEIGGCKLRINIGVQGAPPPRPS
jgi:hypothetical protein